MKKRDRKALDSYIRTVADQIGLRDWTLDLLDEPADEGYDAQVRIIYGRKRAHIRVAKDFGHYKPHQIRSTVAHELIHCHFAAADNMVENDLPEHLGRQAATIFHDSYRRSTEYAVDALAEVLAQHLPLIDWAAKD